MEVFYNLINQIAELTDEQAKDMVDSYKNLFEGMTNNQELINEIRRSMKASGMSTIDVENDKET